LDGGIVGCITLLGKLNEYLELDRSGRDSFEQLIKEVIGRLSSAAAVSVVLFAVILLVTIVQLWLGREK
jgi:hypothetical protein